MTWSRRYAPTDESKQPKEDIVKNKKLKRSDLYIGQLVVVSDNLDAQVRTVAHLFDNSKMVELQWYEGTNHCSQGTDLELYEPTIKQIVHSIALYGKLVAYNDLLNF